MIYHHFLAICHVNLIHQNTWGYDYNSIWIKLRKGERSSNSHGNCRIPGIFDFPTSFNFLETQNNTRSTLTSKYISHRPLPVPGSATSEEQRGKLQKAGFDPEAFGQLQQSLRSVEAAGAWPASLKGISGDGSMELPCMVVNSG